LRFIYHEKAFQRQYVMGRFPRNTVLSHLKGGLLCVRLRGKISVDSVKTFMRSCSTFHRFPACIDTIESQWICHIFARKDAASVSPWILEPSAIPYCGTWTAKGASCVLSEVG
jgi:hypothetical protein